METKVKCFGNPIRELFPSRHFVRGAGERPIIIIWETEAREEQTRLLWVEWRCCSLSLFLFNRWHYLWKQNYENILGEIVFPNPVSLKHLTRVLPLMTAKLSQMGKFILNSHTIQRDQMPLSNLFSASTSNAIY